MSTARKTPNLPNKSGSPKEKGASTLPIDVHRVLAENAPKGKPGPKQKTENELGMSTRPILPRGKSRSKSAVVLSVRLAQEKPKYYEAGRSGYYQSVTAAATAARDCSKTDAHVRRAKSDVRKMTAPQFKEFSDWLAKLPLLPG